MTPYLVSSFQKATLSALIRERFGYDFADIFSKDQITYLFNYLTERGCSAILLEPKYIDREFLEDYSRYYVKRFGNDGYVCGRLHFFSRSIDHKSLDLLLEGRDANGLTADELQKHYLGFMVVKPLSRTFVGKTCLQLAGDKGIGDGTKKKITKQYDVNLFGIKLHVDSIAFQEQDKVVAACATTAIWTALHALPWGDVKHVPSCSEITINALNFVEGSNNGFPNKELTNKQIQRSLDVEGLRYHSSKLKVETREWFRACVTAHIDSNLPLILVGVVHGLARSVAAEEREHIEMISLSEKGNHAVTLLGYDFRLGSNLIYVHDDRLGPYARAELVELNVLLGVDTPADLKDRWALAFRRTDDNGTTWLPAHEILIPDACVVPADKKARLPFQYAYGTAEVIADQIRLWMDAWLSSPTNLIQPENLRFNIKLSSISQVRDHVLEHTLDYHGGETLHTDDEEKITFTETDLERWREDRIQFLTSPMARLQWELDFLWGNKKVFKILLDATDIPLGKAVSGIYVYDPLYAELFFGVIRGLENVDLAADRAHFFGSFVKALELRDVDYEHHLNKAYGALRAPIKLEDSEVSELGKGRNPRLKHYFDPEGDKLTDVFSDIVADPVMRNLIWAIGRDGSLYVAEDIAKPKLGHPSMTGLQAARIAGEMWRTEEDGKPIWHVNYLSGRYSRDYATPKTYLDNAVRKISSFFDDDATFIAKGDTRPPLVEARFAEEKELEKLALMKAGSKTCTELI